MALVWVAYLVRGIVFSKTNTLNSNHNMANINLKCQHLVKNDVTFVRIGASSTRGACATPCTTPAISHVQKRFYFTQALRHIYTHINITCVIHLCDSSHCQRAKDFLLFIHE